MQMHELERERKAHCLAETALNCIPILKAKLPDSGDDNSQTAQFNFIVKRLLASFTDYLFESNAAVDDHFALSNVAFP